MAELTSKFSRGDAVVDLDGRRGTIMLVTHWEGSVWYDVRFGGSGQAVRFDSDLKKDTPE